MEDGGEAAEKALSAGTGDSTALVASASRAEDQQAGRSGSAARASSTVPASPAVVGEATAGAGAAAAAAAAGAVQTTTGATAPAVATSPSAGFGVPLPASSPSSRLRVAAPSPRKSPGLQQVKKKTYNGQRYNCQIKGSGRSS